LHKIDDFFFRTIAWFSLFLLLNGIAWFYDLFIPFSYFRFLPKSRNFVLKNLCIQIFFLKLIRCTLLKIHKKNHHHGILLYPRFIQVPINVICHVVKNLFSQCRRYFKIRKVLYEEDTLLLGINMSIIKRDVFMNITDL